MSRRKGSRNKNVRSDLGKKRKLFNGKKTKPRRKVNGRFIPYVSKRKREDALKVEFWSVEPMSYDGFMNFNSKVRRSMRRIVYGRNRLRVDIYPEDLSTRDKISEVSLYCLWEGEWLLLLRGCSKNKYHSSPRAFAVIKIKDSPEGLKCRVYPSYKRRSLKRLWFWREK